LQAACQHFSKNGLINGWDDNRTRMYQTYVVERAA
jgi:hypothetical protein